jgi:hypothetical protein
MIECLQLNGLSERTQEAYVRAVRQLAEHYRKSPDLINEEELRQYFLYIKNVKHYARNSSTIAICGIKFFFEKTLQRKWATFELLRAPREKKLPVILSAEEVRRILSCVRLLRYPSLPDNDLLVRLAAAGGDESARRRHRQRARHDPRAARKGREGPLCPVGGTNASVAARILEDGACKKFCVNAFFYRWGASCSSNSIANRFKAAFQFLIGIVHFFEADWIAR